MTGLFLVPIMGDSVTGDPIKDISDYTIKGIMRSYQLCLELHLNAINLESLVLLKRFILKITHRREQCYRLQIIIWCYCKPLSY